MRMLDLFSGAGGFSKAAIDAGIEIGEHCFSEINRAAIHNYQYNFPKAQYLGDINNIDTESIGRFDLATFGSPCQGLSLAGKGLGLADPRSALFLKAAQILSVVRPTVFIWENVRGLITRRHRKDFWRALQILANLGGYTLEWQCIDTRWLLPQHRERIYLVGRLGEQSGKEIFPLRESDFGALQRLPEAPVIPTITAGGNSGGLHSGMALIVQRARGFFGGQITDFAPTLNTSSTKTNVSVLMLKEYAKQKSQGYRVYDIQGIAPTLAASMGGGVMPPMIDLSDYEIRRLTPVECERLQGFPDNWTKYGRSGDKVYELSNTARYQLMGNAITKTMAEAIIRKIYNV